MLDPCGLFSHDGRLVSEQLHGDEVLSRSQAQQVARLLVREGKALRGDHLGIGERGPLLAAKRAERFVGHARHRREEQRMLGEEIMHHVGLSKRRCY